ncbi:MAG: hypothetical protein ABS87_02890 [Sphingomonas sp. SCN 67-18]|nr:prolyl oligopeptidase family serine peptidase [Sphingomonas sp. SCN 67-18]ODU22308.1 MAG: hypothetical protein ABS87_02890 [Sphingomonas sp. SCN 67-18]
MRWAALPALLLWALPAGAAAAIDGAPLSLDEVLTVPDVTESLPGPGGGIAWVERVGGTENILYRAPSGVVSRLTDYRADDGEPIRLLAFLGGPDRILFRRGSRQNPANLPDPTQPQSHLVTLDGSATAVPAMDGASGFTAGPGGRQIAFTRGKEIWLMPADDPAAAQRLLTARSRVGGLAWSPDGSRLAYVVDRSDAGRGDYSFVAVIDVARRAGRFMAPGLGADHNPVWSADGRQLAFMRMAPQPRAWRFEDVSSHAPFALIVADPASGAMLHQWQAPRGPGQHSTGFQAEGEDVFARANLFRMADGRLVFPWERTGFRALYGWTPGAGEPKLLSDPQVEVDGAALSPDGRTLVYAAPSRADPDRLDLYRLGSAAPLKPAARGVMRSGPQFLDDGRIAWREASALIPEHLRVGALADAGMAVSTPSAAAPRIAGLLGLAQPLTVARPDGVTVHATLYRSLQAPADGKAPLIVHAHGGSRDKAYPVWQSFFGYPPVLRYLLTRGYHVLSVNYRSGTGYGLAFREPAAYGAKGNDDVDDFIAAARQAAETLPFVDPRRMIAYGHSYGGHIVATALARSDIFAAGIDSAGVADWVYEMESDSGGPLPLNLPERMAVERIAWASSSLSQLDHWGNEPLLLLHGDADGSAALRQTIELYQQLDRRGHAPEAVIFPGEAHALRLMANQQRYIGAIEDFLRRHVPAADATSPAGARPAAAGSPKH